MITQTSDFKKKKLIEISGSSHERLLRTCFVDYDREFVLVALHSNEDGSDQQIVAVGRLSRDRTQKEHGEFAVVVADSLGPN